MTHILRITSRRAGFRRCGVAHPAEATDHARSRWSAEEIEQLKAEPVLIVEELDVVPDQTASTPAKAPAEPRADSPAGDEVKNPEDEREHRIRSVMRKLDRGEKAHFTGSGKPKTESLQEMTGLETISAKERDALWAEVLAATD